VRLRHGVALAAIALVLAGCSGGASREDFENDVRTSRDRVDAALAQVTAAGSFNELVERLRVASEDISGAAEVLADADAPDELRDERDDLAESYRALSNEVGATAQSLQDVGDEGVIQGLNFENWTRVQRILASLRDQDVNVRPLGRH
jgi:hypothetical protein